MALKEVLDATVDVIIMINDSGIVIVETFNKAVEGLFEYEAKRSNWTKRQNTPARRVC